MLTKADSKQLGWPEMRLPILYSMSWPERVPCSEQTWQRLDFLKMLALPSRPDHRSCKLLCMQLGWPDMRLPILYTMSWPERVPCSEQTWQRLDFLKMGDLTFREPDRAKYPAMDAAYAAGRAGGTMTGVLSAANEQVGTDRVVLTLLLDTAVALQHFCWTAWAQIMHCAACTLCMASVQGWLCGMQAVELFLAEKIKYADIVPAVESACDKHQARPQLQHIQALPAP